MSLVLLLAGGTPGAMAVPGSLPAWNKAAYPLRVRLEVDPLGYDRLDKPVEIPWRAGRPGSLHVVEVDERGTVRDDSVEYQYTHTGNEGVLIFLMRGLSPGRQKRWFQAYFRRGDAKMLSSAATPRVWAEDNVFYQGQDSFKITTETAVYYYHKAGSGFASIIDREARDWISYRPVGGSAGRYRGIPNLIHPENQFHPGGSDCQSYLLSQGPLRCTIRSETNDGKWACMWDIFPRYARLTVLKADRPYWFLYEGTPAGRLDPEADYWVRPNGERLPLKESWSGRLAPPRFVYFGSAASKRVLYVVHHDDDGEYDQFWQMEGNMTVFGFGRKYRCCEKSLRLTPARFTVGLEEVSDFTEAAHLIHSAFGDLAIRVGEPEARPESGK